MASLTERFSGKEPLSYEVTVPVVGGQFVIWDAAAALNTASGYNYPKVKVAGVGALNWLGMAKYDAVPGDEFAESAVGYINVPLNSPQPHNVACAHMGVYEVVNAGTATINPGDSAEIVTADGKPGKLTSGMVGGLAIVGFSVSKGPVPPNAIFRLRLGRN